ncbi:2-phosphosulfolactate phosphatase [Agromyces sp. CF514]|uniref:2-phosphosulfolactate phosphatase n=1 Tax=Agromyces sp. CF514 TaxID=1881031 RepID=UPI0008EEF0D2|nr:2-phosphosulfolactate phosphatase [Agromyces sp. CF514]SFR84890.1 2-phosphosulfolactate phosphatase [Agromyces sp. CF514]
MSDSTNALGQAKYQVRFDWGRDGAARLLPGAHVVVLVDALLVTTQAVLAAEHGGSLPIADGAAPDVAATETAELARELGAHDVVVLAASLRNREAVARRILALQEARGERLFVAVVAAGERAGERAAEPGERSDGAPAAGIRFAIEDQLTAGAVIDALVRLGIDHTSPEAAVACAAFEGLRHAAVHLIGAAGTGAGLTADGRRDEVRQATQRDVTDVVPVLRDGVFGP